MILTINKPEIKNNKLVSKIQYENKIYDFYFEVEEEYSKFLCKENSDAFLVSLIPFIIKHNYDVRIVGTISSRIYYQLNSFLIPLLCKKFKKKLPEIECELSNIEFNPLGVGASISCGVDSFYTLLKHRNQKDESYNITHLTFFNAGSHGSYGGENARNLYFKRLQKIKSFCQENNYKLVNVDTNMNELIMMDHEKTHTFRTLGCVLALQKLFGKYYFASGLNFDDTHIDELDTAYYDILNVQCFSSQNLQIYLSGIEKNRMEKIEYISNYKETYNWLNVCVHTDNWENCGKCNKCIRTMTALDSINKLKYYKNVFDVEYFYKNKSKIIKQMYKMMYDKTSKIYYSEIINSYKKNNKKIPKTAFLYYYIPNKNNIKKIIKKILPDKIVCKIKEYRIKKYNIKDGWMN